MPGSVYHQLTATTPDDPAYEIRPSHFNQSHLVTINATGSEISNAFSNANGFSFGVSAGAITGSYTVPSVPSVTEYFSKTNTTFNGANISGSITHNTDGLQLSLSVSPGGAGDGVNVIAAGTQTANTTGTVLFNNANGITFGMSNNSVVTASHNALTTAMASNAATISNIRVSAGTTSNLLSAVTFNDGNGVSFGLNASTITASHNGLTSQSNQNVTAANGGFAFQTLSFSNVNGISFGTSAGSAITASHNALTTAMASNRGSDFVQATAAFAGTSASGTIASNGISVSIGPYITTAMLSNAATISNIRLSAGTTSNLLSAVTLADGNGLSFGLNAGTVTGSYSRPVVSNAIASVGSATNSGTNTSRFAADDHVHAGVFSMGVSTAGNTSGDTRVDVGRFVLQGGNGITLSQVTAANALNTIVVSAGPGGAGDGGVFVGVSTGGNTLGTTGTVSTGNVVFVGTNGITLSQSTGAAGSAATITLSGFQRTNSGFDPYMGMDYTVASFGHGSLHLNPVECVNFQCDRIVVAVNNTNSSNSSGSHTLSFDIGLYSRNSNSLSRVVSTSGSRAATHSGTAGSYSLLSGVRLITIPFTTTITEGQYWVAFLSRTASGGANGSYSQRVVDQLGSNISGHFGSSSHATLQYVLGRGFYSASTAALPQSIAFSEITGSGSLAQRVPWVVFGATTY